MSLCSAALPNWAAASLPACWAKAMPAAGKLTPYHGRNTAPASPIAPNAETRSPYRGRSPVIVLTSSARSPAGLIHLSAQQQSLDLGVSAGEPSVRVTGIRAQEPDGNL